MFAASQDTPKQDDRPHDEVIGYRMPSFSQINAADQAHVSSLPVTPSTGMADGQGSSGTFAALLQDSDASLEVIATASDGKAGNSVDQSDEHDPRLRIRKSAAEMFDPAVVQAAFIAQPVPPFATGSGPLALQQVATEGTGNSREEVPTKELPQQTQPEQGDATIVQSETDVSTPAQAGDSGSTLQALLQAKPPELSTAHAAARSTSETSPVASATTRSSFTVTAQSSALNMAAKDTSAALNGGPASLAWVMEHVKPIAPKAEEPTESSTPALVPNRTLREREQLNTGGLPMTAAYDSLQVLNVNSDVGAQGLTANSALQDGLAFGITPAVPLQAQSFGDDQSSQSQDGADDGTSPGQKSRQVGTHAVLADGSQRFGLNGWVASTQHAGSPAVQRNSPDAHLPTSSGMTHMNLDRVASASSARRLTDALRSDMAFSVQTDAFGKVNIQASLRGDQLASQISLEHAHLHASALANHMSVLETRLGEKYNLNASVTVQDSAAGMSGKQQSSQEGDRRSSKSVPMHKVAQTDAVTHLSQLSPILPALTAERLSSANDRLDLLI